MSDMKLIMENWRKYNNQRTTVPMVLIENGELICFDLNERLRSLNESNNSEEINILFEKWLVQTEAMLNENVVTDFFGDVKDKAAKLTGQAKQFFTELVDDPYLTLSLQLWSFLQKIKNVSFKQLTRIASVVSKLNNARKDFKKSNPRIYSVLSMVTKVAAVFLAVMLIQALTNSDSALAAINTARKVKVSGGIQTVDAGVIQANSERAQRIIGVIADHNSSVADEISRAIASPSEIDITSLTDAAQDALIDADNILNTDISGFDITKFRKVGKQILDSLDVVSPKVTSPIDPSSVGPQASSLIDALKDNMPMLIKKGNIDQLTDMVKQIQDLGAVSPEDMKQINDIVSKSTEYGKLGANDEYSLFQLSQKAFGLGRGA